MANGRGTGQEQGMKRCSWAKERGRQGRALAARHFHNLNCLICGAYQVITPLCAASTFYLLFTLFMIYSRPLSLAGRGTQVICTLSRQLSVVMTAPPKHCESRLPLFACLCVLYYIQLWSLTLHRYTCCQPRAGHQLAQCNAAWRRRCLLRVQHQVESMDLQSQLAA